MFSKKRICVLYLLLGSVPIGRSTNADVCVLSFISRIQQQKKERLHFSPSLKFFTNIAAGFDSQFVISKGYTGPLVYAKKTDIWLLYENK